MRARVRTLIVDDSALVRALVSESLARDPGIEVVGTAVDAYAARDKILALDPDVITLDIEMPRMDGITFLKLVMKHHPMPVVVMSSLTRAGSDKALEALQAGAVEVIAKPGSVFTVADATELAAKIKAAACSRFRRRVRSGDADPASIEREVPHGNARSVEPSLKPAFQAAPYAGPELRQDPRLFSPRQVILIGASTGGTEALKAVLSPLRADLPGICVVQHIAAHFSTAFAERLNQLCRLEVREACDGDCVQPGRVLIAPGGRHMLLRSVGGRYVVELNDGPKVNHQRPAVDALFDSALKAGAAPTALAMVLTGMGSDGAAAMLRLKEAGARTLAQDEASCVVFGMPREAIRMGAADEVLPLGQMGARIERHASAAALRVVAR